MLVGLAVFFLFCLAGKKEGDASEKTTWDMIKQNLALDAADALHKQYLPIISFLKQEENNALWITEKQIWDIMPYYGYAVSRNGRGEQENIHTQEELGDFKDNSPKQDEKEFLTEQLGETNLEELMLAENEESQRISKEQQEKLLQEQLLQEQTQNQTSVPFVPHTLQQEVNIGTLSEYETLVKNFYTIDSNTMAGSDQLAVDKLMEKNMQISKDGEGPQILIYHTHSQEAFADSVPGDKSTTIVGVGDYLSELLTSRYGYKVLHHTGEYDVKARDDAYSVALPALEQVLAENPSIEVVIDLHRDEMAEETRLVMDLDGRPTARFMFFNGLSRTRKTGNISYLKNENLEDNLAFSFQMQLKAAQYYPGLTRKIYLKGYRYNMHLRPKTLLVELGAQNNTVEEAMNACDPLAHILDMVLSGQ